MLSVILCIHDLFLILFSPVMRILPCDMRPYVHLEDIVILHKSMSDLMPGQAVLQFIEVLKSWPLFGASVFEISVSELFSAEKYISWKKFYE